MTQETKDKLWWKVLDDKEYAIAKSAWATFLKFHGHECDIEAAIDTIAEGVLDIARTYNKSHNYSECSDCQWLLYYEWDEITKRHDMPRCSIEFRKGIDVKRPCPDKKKETKPSSSTTRVRDSHLD